MSHSVSATCKHYGFSLLRALMSFVVITCHFWETPTPYPLVNYLDMLKPLAVPVFMMTSFFFVSKSFFDIQPHTVRQRMLRLIRPQVAWAVLYWIILFPLGQASIGDLFWQIATGHSAQLNATMWFQTAMILISALFFALFRFLRKQNAMIAVAVLGVLALIFQYSGLNHLLFAHLRYELSYPLGRLAEVLPYASAGVFLRYFRADQLLQKWPIVSVAFGCALAVLALAAERLLPLPAPGFSYSGIYLFLKGLAVFVIAAAVPLHGLSKPAAKTLDVLTRYTLGIYCIHRLVERVLFITPAGNWLCSTLGIGSTSLAMCAVIYLLSYFCCVLIGFIPLKSVKQLVS